MTLTSTPLPGALVPAAAPAPHGVELDGALLFVVDAGGQRYAGYALSGDVPLRVSLARTLSSLVECLFEAAP